MSRHDFRPGPSPFDLTHHLRGLAVPGMFALRSETHGAAEKSGPANVGGWSRDIAECDYHVCHVNRVREVYDSFGGHLSYVGTCRSDADAISKWKNYLYAAGVHVENAGDA